MCSLLRRIPILSCTEGWLVGQFEKKYFATNYRLNILDNTNIKNSFASQTAEKVHSEGIKNEWLKYIQLRLGIWSRIILLI